MKIIVNLKVCPFCGSRALVKTYDYHIDDDVFHTYCVECTHCHVETVEKAEREEAIHDWNQRCPNSDETNVEIISDNENSEE